MPTPTNEIHIASVLIEDAHCHLNHGPGIDIKKIPATDVLVAPFGKHGTKIDLTIPVCHECAVELQHGDGWVLNYCLDCHASQWVSKQLSKRSYGDTKIIWRHDCPKCTARPGRAFCR